MRIGLAISMIGLTLGLASCGRAPAEPLKKYQLKGQVASVDPANHTAKINGEKIEGWMEAMTMDYPIKDEAEFKKLSVGQSVTATVFVQGTDYWLGDIGAGAQPDKK